MRLAGLRGFRAGSDFSLSVLRGLSDPWGRGLARAFEERGLFDSGIDSLPQGSTRKTRRPGTPKARPSAVMLPRSRPGRSPKAGNSLDGEHRPKPLVWPV